MTLGSPFAILGMGAIVGLGLYGIAYDICRWWRDRFRAQLGVAEAELDALRERTARPPSWLTEDDLREFGLDLDAIRALPTLEPRREPR